MAEGRPAPGEIERRTTSAPRLGLAALLGALVFLARLHPAEAGINVWTSNGPEVVPSIAALVIDPQTPTTLYASLAAWGVFKSTDGGGHWSNTLAPHGGAWSLAIDPQTPTTLYAGRQWVRPEYGEASILKSTDGGGTWRDAYRSGETGIYGLAIDPQTPRIVYALYAVPM
jgi:hypothetical protein